MKKIVILLLAMLTVLSIGVSAFAQGRPDTQKPVSISDVPIINNSVSIPTGGGLITYMHPTQMIGTVRYCVEEIQHLTGLINEAICLGDNVSYDAKMAEMASLIMQANSAMSDSGIPNRLNLWNVYNQLRQRKGDGCNSGTDPLSHADWAREELDRVGQQIGSIEFDHCPYGNQKVWTAGNWYYGYYLVDSDGDPILVDGKLQYIWYLQNHDLTWEVSHCAQNGTIHWDPTEGAYDDDYYDVNGNPR